MGSNPTLSAVQSTKAAQYYIMMKQPIQNAATFYIVRHGLTHLNVQGRLQGQIDSPLTDLTEQGVIEIKEVAHSLKNISFDLVYSSDLLRAKRTAEILLLDRKIAINTTKLLRERSFGKYEGVLATQFNEENRELIEKRTALSKEENWKFKYADDHESDEEMMTRLLAFFREVAVAWPEKTILVVAHGGIIRVLLMHLGYNIEHKPGVVKNGAYIKLLSNGDEFQVEKLNGITLL